MSRVFACVNTGVADRVRVNIDTNGNVYGITSSGVQVSPLAISEDFALCMQSSFRFGLPQESCLASSS